MLAALCFIWAGMVLGISFLATPVKFTAPSITLPIALDVGRHVFGAFDKVEIAWLIVALGLIIMTRAPRKVWVPLLIAGFSVAVQVVYLMPILDTRVTTFMMGQVPPPEDYHFILIAVEVLKLVCLIVAGTAALGTTRPGSRAQAATS